MNGSKPKNLLFLLLIVTSFSVTTLGGLTGSDPNSFYKIGDFKDIEMLFPKQGYIGAPPSASPRIISRGKPKDKEDFNCTYLRTRILDIIKINNNARIDFRVDRIDPNSREIIPQWDRQQKEVPLFLFHLFISPRGCVIMRSVGSWPGNRISVNVEEFSLGRIDREGWEDPFTTTFPSDLSPERNMKENSFVANGSGIIFQEQTKPDSSGNIIVNIQYVETVESSLKSNLENIKYFLKTDKILSNIKEKDSVEVFVIGKETQVWADSNDWLWQEMERFDADGNVTMKCQRMK